MGSKRKAGSAKRQRYSKCGPRDTIRVIFKKRTYSMLELRRVKTCTKCLQEEERDRRIITNQPEKLKSVDLKGGLSTLFQYPQVTISSLGHHARSLYVDVFIDGKQYVLLIDTVLMKTIVKPKVVSDNHKFLTSNGNFTRLLEMRQLSTARLI